MRDVVNPFLLFVVVLLIACRSSWADAAATCDLWGLVVCSTAFLVNLALGVARACAHRKASLMKVVWAMVFLLVGSAVFLLPGGEGQETSSEESDLRALLSLYRQDPSWVQGEQGKELVVLAASTSKTHLLRELIQTRGVADNRPLLSVALQAAAEKGHLSVAELLIHHVSLNEMAQGGTPLVAAVSAGKHKMAELLLKAGADPNLADAEGTPPLIHAVLAESRTCVQLLVRYGADPSRTDADGRDAASYSNSEEIDSLLTELPPAG